jgi:hypothetical protein
MKKERKMEKEEKSQDELKAIYKERGKWFQDRIGKRIYRNKNSCDCKTCEIVYKNGLIISDENHASYLQDCEAELNLHYTDSPPESQDDK